MNGPFITNPSETGYLQFEVQRNWQGKPAPHPVVVWVRRTDPKMVRKVANPNCQCKEMFSIVKELLPLGWPQVDGALCACVGRVIE